MPINKFLHESLIFNFIDSNSLALLRLWFVVHTRVKLISIITRSTRPSTRSLHASCRTSSISNPPLSSPSIPPRRSWDSWACSLINQRDHVQRDSPTIQSATSRNVDFTHNLAHRLSSIDFSPLRSTVIVVWSLLLCDGSGTQCWLKLELSPSPLERCAITSSSDGSSRWWWGEKESIFFSSFNGNG